MALWPFYLAFAVVFCYYLTRPSEPLYVPTVRYSRFLPDFINRILYYVTAPALIHRGYEKVHFLCAVCPGPLAHLV